LGAIGTLRRLTRTLLAPRTRFATRQILTWLLAPYSALRARKLARRRPLRLNLASGSSPLAGWVNVDLVGSGADLAWRLERRLPFRDGSCQAVFVEHFFEHLDLSEAIALGAELYRLLAPGGVARVGVPDFGRYAASYLEGSPGGDDLIERYRPGRPTPLVALSEVVYLHGHRSLWDEQTLVALLAEAGFERPAAQPSGVSAIDPAPDNPERSIETLYVEASR
jgi:predicted SAM-dependent methyltransferase